MTGGHDPGNDPSTAGGSAERAEDEFVGEPRWPMAGAVLALMVLTILLPGDVRTAGPKWVFPLIEGVLLVALIARDPGRIDVRSRRLRMISIVLVSVLVLATLSETVLLIDDLIHGGGVTNSANELLAAGAIVWVSNSVAFALVYWELDGGGAAARAHHLPTHADFGFPQQLSPRIAQANWRPRFIDYLYLGLTNATAFSPTDVMPLVPWAKIAMGVQSVISLVVFGLVIARAVNVFA